MCVFGSIMRVFNDYQSRTINTYLSHIIFIQCYDETTFMNCYYKTKRYTLRNHTRFLNQKPYKIRIY